MKGIAASLRFFSVGPFSRDYIIPINSHPADDVPGGDAIYAAVGMRLWNEFPGICTRVSPDIPAQWLQKLENYTLDTDGMVSNAELPDETAFYAYPNQDQCISENPINQYLKINATLPKPLLGYVNPVMSVDSQTQIAQNLVRANEIPPRYLEANSAHLGSLDYASYNSMLHVLKQGGVHNISIDPGAGCMNSRFYEVMKDIVRDVIIFNTNEFKIRQLFYGKKDDLWEMAEQLGTWGADVVAIRMGSQGYLVYERDTKKRWVIPNYPAAAIDPTGIEAVFCGAFLTGYIQHYDPVLAGLMGSIAVSFKIEGIGPFYPLETLPDLIMRRLDRLRDSVHTI